MSGLVFEASRSAKEAYPCICVWDNLTSLVLSAGHWALVAPCVCCTDCTSERCGRLGERYIVMASSLVVVSQGVCDEKWLEIPLLDIEVITDATAGFCNGVGIMGRDCCGGHTWTSCCLQHEAVQVTLCGRDGKEGRHILCLVDHDSGFREALQKQIDAERARVELALAEERRKAAERLQEEQRKAQEREAEARRRAAEERERAENAAAVHAALRTVREWTSTKIIDYLTRLYAVSGPSIQACSAIVQRADLNGSALLAMSKEDCMSLFASMSYGDRLRIWGGILKAKSQ